MRQILFLLLLMPAFLKSQPCTGGLVLSTQQQIDNFPISYPGCTTFNGPITIKETVAGAIINVDGLSSLQNITGQLKIENNAELDNLNGLGNLITIGGEFFIGSNGGLSSLADFQNLNSIGSNITIQLNPMLINLSGFEGITSGSGDIKITNNSSLQSLTGLENLQSINGLLQIRQNTSLTSISALQNLGSINGSLVLMQNSSLPNLQGLENIDHTTISHVTISFSFMLSECEVASICDYLDIPTNTASISLNANGCNSRTEVEAACSIVPVVWIKPLRASLRENHVHLEWVVAEQENNAAFFIEWSNDGKEFEIIDHLNGANNYQPEISYEYIHFNPAGGRNYYRIKQEDVDGSFSFSTVISILFKPNTLLISPNPVYDYLEINTASDEVLFLINMQGKIMREIAVDEEKKVIDISDLPSGIFLPRSKKGSMIKLVKL